MITSSNPLTILHLYPREMNLYGDHGNVLCLRRRLEWRGIPVRVLPLETGDPFPDRADILFGGGGQDSGQSRIEEDLLKRGDKIRSLIEEGTPALFICGLYQLLGREFLPLEGAPIRGIGVFPAHTAAGKERLVGNITIDAPPFGPVTGFENHSGRTYLEGAAVPFGRVLRGKGNNGRDHTEGIRCKNCIGTYLHGPILPKNPAVADFLILTALRRRDPAAVLAPLDDAVEEAAAKSAAARPV